MSVGGDRVAVRVLIVASDKVLLVKEKSDEWWAFPGGGVDHGDPIGEGVHDRAQVAVELGLDGLQKADPRHLQFLA